MLGEIGKQCGGAAFLNASHQKLQALIVHRKSANTSLCDLRKRERFEGLRISDGCDKPLQPLFRKRLSTTREHATVLIHTPSSGLSTVRASAEPQESTRPKALSDGRGHRFVFRKRSFKRRRQPDAIAPEAGLGRT
jgi:hypothetical protein